jgi:hypothetical protein
MPIPHHLLARACRRADVDELLGTPDGVEADRNDRHLGVWPVCKSVEPTSVERRERLSVHSQPFSGNLFFHSSALASTAGPSFSSCVRLKSSPSIRSMPVVM